MATGIPDQGGTDVDEAPSDRKGSFVNGADHPTQPVPVITDEVVAAAQRNSDRAMKRGLRKRSGTVAGAPETGDGTTSGAGDGTTPGGAAQSGVTESGAQAPPAGRGKRTRFGRVPGMPNTSPWQRSHAVWHSAGVDWVHRDADLSRLGPKDPAPSVPRAGAESAAPAVPSTAVDPGVPSGPADRRVVAGQPGPAAQPAANGAPATTTGPVTTTGPATTAEPATTARRSPASGRPASERPVAAAVPARPGGSGGSRRRLVAVAAGIVLLAGAGGYAVLRDDDRPHVAGPVAVRADQIFALDPAGRIAGRAHSLEAVAASGDTVVAVGSELGGPDRGQFLTSLDGGRTWRLARVRAADGQEPPPGEFPRQLAGGAGAWVALGGADAGAAVWTSRDGLNWTRQPDTAAAVFGPADRVTGLARTGSGFVAVGGTSPGGGTGSRGTAQGVVWTSTDGRTWQRTLADQLKLGEVSGLDRVVAAGDVLVAEGETRKTTTKTVTKKVKNKTTKSKVTSTTKVPGFWRSADGGRTWTAVKIPQAQGSEGAVKGLAAGPGGFYAARDGVRTTGPKKRKRTTRFAVLFGSPDGRTWSPTTRIEPAGYGSLDRLSGSAAGLAALVRPAKGGAGMVLRSPDGRTWRQMGTVPAPAGGAVTGLAVLSSGTVVAGRRGKEAAFLSMAGAGDVDLTKIAGAVLPERTVTALTPNGAGLVAVGSGSGDAAVWTTRDGHAWARGQGDFGGAGPQRLTGLARGDQGWVAVGRSGDEPVRPLVMTSGDGVAWQRSGSFPGGDDVTATAAAHGPAGYVVVGSGRSEARAWHTTDLKTWRKGKGDLGGGRAMRDVAAGPAGFVAVGTQTGNTSSQPAAWTSTDGRTWTAAAAPALPPAMVSGGLSRVAARGNTVVAIGSATAAAPGGETAPARTPSYAFAALSTDGGRTWQTRALPGITPGSTLTALTTTAKGFVIAAAVGLPGRTDVVLWSAADGRTWRRTSPHGTGLDGPGAQVLTGLAAAGPDLVAVGVNADHQGDVPILWRTPAP